MSKHTTLEQLKLSQQRTKTEVGKVEARVKTLEDAGYQANVLEGVKVNGVALAIAEKMIDILIAEGSANGKISVNGVDVTVKGLAALAYKSEIGADELASALKTQIDNATSDITTLKGSGDGSITKMIDNALNTFATNVTDDDVVNTYKELIDWAASHGSDAAEMAAAISTLQSKTTLGTYDDNGTQKEYASVKAYVEAVIAGLGMGDYYTKTEIDTALNGKVDKETGKGLSANDFSDTYKTKLDNIETATDTEVSNMLDEVWGSSSGD